MFSEQYLYCNPSDDKAAQDKVLILAFAIVMLNTDLHSPNVKKKMSEPGWRVWRPVWEDADLDRDQRLSRLYVQGGGKPSGGETYQKLDSSKLCEFCI